MYSERMSEYTNFGQILLGNVGIALILEQIRDWESCNFSKLNNGLDVVLVGVPSGRHSIHFVANNLSASEQNRRNQCPYNVWGTTIPLVAAATLPNFRRAGGSSTRPLMKSTWPEISLGRRALGLRTRTTPEVGDAPKKMKWNEMSRSSRGSSADHLCCTLSHHFERS